MVFLIKKSVKNNSPAFFYEVNMKKTAPYLDMTNVKATMDKILNTFQASDVVFERTLKDMYSRAPGKVASAVTSVYGIKKKDINVKKGYSKAAAGNILTRGR